MGQGETGPGKEGREKEEVVDCRAEPACSARLLSNPQVHGKKGDKTMRKWECTVCGYIHTGDEPPDECPMCGADKSKFVEITSVADTPSSHEAAVPDDKAAGAEGDSLFGRLVNLVLQNHLHPIAVHTPNGIVPAAVLFLLLAYIFQLSSFELAAFYNLVFVLLAMPLVVLSGLIEWHRHYKAARTTLFLTKIGCGMVVMTSLLILVLWRIADPEVAAPASSTRWMYFLIHVIALGAVGMAGHLGGKLVFAKSRNKKRK
jgi:uncharacterized membrane protein/rubredoxin